MMARNPSIAAIALITLALGIGANTAVFSVVYGIIFNPLGYPEEDRLVYLCGSRPSEGKYHAQVSVPNYLDWREKSTSFAHMGLYGYASHTLAGAGHPKRIEVLRVTPDVLPVLGFDARIGRRFLPEEGQPGQQHVAMLSSGFWRRTFGADPDIVGQQIVLDDVAFTVLGVLPPELDEAWGESEIWVPLVFEPSDYDRSRFWYRAIGRLKPGISIDDARTEMETIAARLADAYPESNAGWTVNILPIARWVVGDTTRLTLWTLMLVVVFVLLIACANVANLLLARATARRKEFVVRSALGATRGRLIRQTIAECTVLGLGGGALGLLLAFWGVAFLTSFLPPSVPRRDAIGVDGHVLLFTLLVSLAAAVLSSLLPAFRSSRADLSRVLNQESQSISAGSTRRYGFDFLVIAQVAIAMTLVVCAGLLIQSVIALDRVDPGFDSGGVLTMRMRLPALNYDSDEKRVAFFEDLTRRMGRIRGVESVGAVCSPPLAGQVNRVIGTIEDYVSRDPQGVEHFGIVVATPGYFETMAIPLLRGHNFTEYDNHASQQVVIVNERFAEQYWPDSDPIGKHLKYGARDSDNPWMTVVGVVGNVKRDTLDEDAHAETYRPHAQVPRSTMTVVARTVGDPDGATAALRGAIGEVDPHLAVYWVRPMKDIVSRRIKGAAVVAALMSAFSFIGLAMAGVGLYGVMSYVVNQRTQEIGLRVALGAEVRDVLRLVVVRSLILTVLGVGFGAVLAIIVAHGVGALLFSVSPIDPVTLAGVATLLVMIATAATLWPALRATKVDPMVALRCE
jgi:putative ABC transport system permease protein